MVLNSRKALVIDDSMTVRKIIKGILLSSCGCTEIVQKENGKVGLEEAIKNRYDVIILDWYMPELDGIDVLLQLRSKNNPTPVIICTSAGDKESIVNGITAGANEYIVKPFEPAVLQSKVEKVIADFSLRIRQKSDKRILIVEDSKVIGGAIRQTILKDGKIPNIVMAEDGDSALDIFFRQKFDLVLLDWQMPRMEGIDVLKEIRKVDKHTPVIMATGNSSIDQIVEAFDAGASNFIPKPFVPDDLLEKIYQLVFPGQL